MSEFERELGDLLARAAPARLEPVSPAAVRERARRLRAVRRARALGGSMVAVIAMAALAASMLGLVKIADGSPPRTAPGLRLGTGYWYIGGSLSTATLIQTGSGAGIWRQRLPSTAGVGDLEVGCLGDGTIRVIVEAAGRVLADFPARPHPECEFVDGVEVIRRHVHHPLNEPPYPLLKSR